MNNFLNILIVLSIFFASSVFANLDTDTENINAILSSEVVMSKIKPTQTFQAIFRKGDSYAVRLRNTDGSCEQYSAVVLTGISTSQEYIRHVVISDKPQECK